MIEIVDFRGGDMRKADRLFEIIEMMRTSDSAVTAADLSEELGVSERTIYRDIAGLQGQGVPIEGEAGIGYVLRPGFHMPPLMFTPEELEAIVLGARFAAQRGGSELEKAAERVLVKVKSVVPQQMQDRMERIALYAPPLYDAGFGTADMSDIRDCIRNERKMRIGYMDLKERVTERTIWPIAIAFFAESTLLAAWCELRNDFRHFRIDRIREVKLLDEAFNGGGGRLLRSWEQRVTSHYD